MCIRDRNPTDEKWPDIGKTTRQAIADYLHGREVNHIFDPYQTLAITLACANGIKEAQFSLDTQNSGLRSQRLFRNATASFTAILDAAIELQSRAFGMIQTSEKPSETLWLEIYKHARRTDKYTTACGNLATQAWIALPDSWKRHKLLARPWFLPEAWQTFACRFHADLNSLKTSQAWTNPVEQTFPRLQQELTHIALHLFRVTARCTRSLYELQRFLTAEEFWDKVGHWYDTTVSRPLQWQTNKYNNLKKAPAEAMYLDVTEATPAKGPFEPTAPPKTPSVPERPHPAPKSPPVSPNRRKRYQTKDNPKSKAKPKAKDKDKTKEETKEKKKQPPRKLSLIHI